MDIFSLKKSASPEIKYVVPALSSPKIFRLAKIGEFMFASSAFERGLSGSK